MKLFSAILASTLVFVLGTGCATIIQPGPDRIMVNSEPPGAKVTLDGAPIGSTPLQVAVNRKDEGVFMISKEGYSPITIDRDKVLAGWTIVNVLFWPGFIVDLATSNQGKYAETPIFVDLAPRSSEAKSSKDSVKNKD